MPYKDREKRLESQRKYRKNNHELMREKARDYIQKNREIIKKKNILKYYELKRWIFEYYGYVCVCCGENNPRFLTIDHVNNDGYKDRNLGSRIYSTIKREIISGNDSRFQIYCYNCNCAKRLNKGVCPHKDIGEIKYGR